MKKRANVHRQSPLLMNPEPMEGDFFVPLIDKGLKMLWALVQTDALFWGSKCPKPCPFFEFLS